MLSTEISINCVIFFITFKTRESCSRARILIGSVVVLGMPKRMLIKSFKKKRARKWMVCDFSWLSRILVGYVFVGARCGWGWAKSIWTGHEKEEKRACVYICVCERVWWTSFIFRLCSTVSAKFRLPIPFLLGFSTVFSFSPTSSCFTKHTKQPIGRLQEELAFALGKDWVVPSHPSICRSSRAAFCLRPDAHRRTNWGKWSSWDSTSFINSSSSFFSNF